MKAASRNIFILLLTLFITSCGFQLRGALDNSFNSIQIDGASAGFTKVIKKKYKQSGIEIRDSSADKVIEIIKDEFGKRILTLSSTGTIREYELNYSVL